MYAGSCTHHPLLVLLFIAQHQRQTRLIQPCRRHLRQHLLATHPHHPRPRSGQHSVRNTVRSGGSELALRRAPLCKCPLEV